MARCLSLYCNGLPHLAVRDIDEQELLTLIDKIEISQPFVLFLYTPFCGTCKAAMRMLQVVEAMLADTECEFLQLNMNFSPKFVKRYQIRSVPGLLVFQGDRRQPPQAKYDMLSVQHLFHFIKDVIR